MATMPSEDWDSNPTMDLRISSRTRTNSNPIPTNNRAKPTSNSRTENPIDTPDSEVRSKRTPVDMDLSYTLSLRTAHIPDIADAATESMSDNRPKARSYAPIRNPNNTRNVASVVKPYAAHPWINNRNSTAPHPIRTIRTHKSRIAHMGITEPNSYAPMMDNSIPERRRESNWDTDARNPDSDAMRP